MCDEANKPTCDVELYDNSSTCPYFFTGSFAELTEKASDIAKGISTGTATVTESVFEASSEIVSVELPRMKLRFIPRKHPDGQTRLHVADADWSWTVRLGHRRRPSSRRAPASESSRR